MKNVTIALDDETHRRARIRAAEMGSSLSALVKEFLQGLDDGSASKAASGGVREMPMTFKHAPAPASDVALPSGAFGFSANGKPYYTKDGKPRKPGAMRGMGKWTEDFDSWPDGFIDAMYGEDTPASNTWWLGMNDKLQKPDTE